MNRRDEIREQKKMGTAMQVLAWIVLLGFGVVWFGDVLEKQRNPNQSLQTHVREGGIREVVLKRNRFGHYVTSGKIKGKPVTFMLDTGATGVAIGQATATALGLKRGRAFPTQTANGVSTSYAVNLDRVSVGDIELNDVAAGISPGLGTEEVLLGMSFLKHIEFTQRGDTLILRQ